MHTGRRPEKCWRGRGDASQLRSYTNFIENETLFGVLQALGASYLNLIDTCTPFAPLALVCPAINVGIIKSTHPDLSVVIASAGNPVHAWTSLLSHALPEAFVMPKGVLIP